MLQLIIAFVVGMIVMDIMWAVKLGIPQLMYYNWKHRNDPITNYEEQS